MTTRPRAADDFDAIRAVLEQNRQKPAAAKPTWRYKESGSTVRIERDVMRRLTMTIDDMPNKVFRYDGVNWREIEYI